MRIQRLLVVSTILATLSIVPGCANRSAYPQYPQYPQQAYPYAGQPYTGQPGQVFPIQQSPAVGQQPQGIAPAGFQQPPNYTVPTGYYGPPPGYAGQAPSSYNAPGNTPFFGR